MSDQSDQEKTESPTPHRIEKAREEGQVPRSRELTSLLMLLAGVAILWFGGASLARRLSVMLAAGLRFDHHVINDPALIVRQITSLMGQTFIAMLPLISGLMIMAIVAPLVPGGVLFSSKAVKFNLAKLNPLAGIKRLFSSQALAEMLKAVLKVTLVGAVAGGYLWHNWFDILKLISESPDKALPDALRLLALCVFFIVPGLLPMVGFDVFWQLYSHTKKLRMSRQDIRDEFKQQEGDPHVKGRIRQQQRAAARRRMMADVPKADVIITNPTHYAVALQYDENKMNAPKMLAKGRGLIALRIREIGDEHRIPVLEAPPLARALYHHTEPGQQIPGQLYTAVAQVLAWVWQLRRWRVAGGLIPKKPENLPVPEALDLPHNKKDDHG